MTSETHREVLREVWACGIHRHVRCCRETSAGSYQKLQHQVHKFPSMYLVDIYLHVALSGFFFCVNLRLANYFFLSRHPDIPICYIISIHILIMNLVISRHSIPRSKRSMTWRHSEILFLTFMVFLKAMPSGFGWFWHIFSL